MEVEVGGRAKALDQRDRTAVSLVGLELKAGRVAARARTVLITGESGASKEVLAREMHALAHPQAGAPFVAVNCGAIPETLIEAALFGHERGAFTGADRQRRGYVEQAHGGTLFLDEIAELTPAMQVRLLRVLQDRQVQRLGGEALLSIDVRVICATHRDLQQLVQQGRFEKTCTTASTSCTCVCRHCANVPMTCRVKAWRAERAKEMILGRLRALDAMPVAV